MEALLSDLFCSAHLSDSSMLLHVSVVCSFSLLSDIPLYGDTTVRVSVHLDGHLFEFVFDLEQL